MNDDTTSVTAALFGLVGFAAREPGPAGLQVGVRAGRVGGCGGVTDGGRSARLRPPRRDRRRRRRPTALKSVLHDWQDEPAIEILRTCRRAARTGTALLVIERQFALPGTKLSDLNMLVGPGGRERTAEEYAALLAAAGYELVGETPTAADVSVFEARAI
jgi:hypothetical protein